MTKIALLRLCKGFARYTGKGTPCEVFSSDVKVRICKRKSYYYPDVVVGCSKDDDADEYYLE